MPAAGKNSADVGWMYHISNKNRNTEPVGVPPASQIPGLSQIAPEAPTSESFRGVIKESDSAYVRLAKQGGRADLLAFREPKPRPQQPKGYPKVDWYYLEDNAQQDAADTEAQKNQPYEFALPDYMVHHGYAGGGRASENAEQDDYAPKRAPFHFDNKSVFQREEGGASVTDKTVRIEEPSAAGHGVRNSKQKKPITKNKELQKKEKDGQESRFHNVPNFANDDGKPQMSKILSFGYSREWETKRDEWLEEKAKIQAVKASVEQEEATRKLEESRKSRGEFTTGSSPKMAASQQPKEPFKMSKFKNVPAKTNTRRNDET